MKRITTVIGNTISGRVFGDHAKADAAYEKLKAAMAKYEKYGNAKDETVEIEGDNGLSAVRIENLLSVSIEDMDADIDLVVAMKVREEKINAKTVAALAPE